MSEDEDILVAGHEELGLAGFSQPEQITVFWIWRYGASGEIRTKEREVPKACSEQFDRARAKPRSKKWPAGNFAELRDECITSDQREFLSLPSIQQSSGCSKRR